MPGDGERHDFFVSHTGDDEAWAEWIAWHIRDLGFSVTFQKWDFGPGHSFVAQMDDALRRSDRVLAVLSERYLASRFGAEEWQAKWAEGEGLVVPVRIDDVSPPGLLRGVVYVDLFRKSAGEARELLRVRLTELGPPGEAPVFPGDGAAHDDAFPANLAFVGVPDRRAFVGRVNELESLAAVTDTAVVTQVAAGMGGVGKTALAIEYAHRYRSTFSWVGWVTAGSRAALIEGLAGLAESLDVLVAEDPEVTATRVKAALAKAVFRWLLIVDNVTDPYEIDGLLPQTGNGQVAITSRHGDWTGTTVDPIGVNVLSLDEAVDLLLKLTSSSDREGAATVANRLGRLAIALEQAGASMRQRSWGFGRYLEMMAERPALVLADQLKGLDRTVAEVLTSSIEQATVDAPYAEVVLSVFAYLAPDNIPRWLLDSGVELGFPSVNVRRRWRPRRRRPHGTLLTSVDAVEIGDAIAAGSVRSSV